MPRTHSFEAKLQKNRSFTQRLADEITRLAGSFGFFLINVLFFISWISINISLFPQISAFDPFPFPLLTTIVSLEAIILAVFVLISQNRQGQIDSLREEIHLQINEIAEKEITKSLKLLTEIHAKTVGNSEPDPELERMLKTLNTAKIESKLEKEMEPQPLVISEFLDQAEKKLGLKK
jgi:uncharacterized membrane protein